MTDLSKPIFIGHGEPIGELTIKTADRTNEAKLAELNVKLMEAQELLSSAQTLIEEVTDALNGNEPVGW